MGVGLPHLYHTFSNTKCSFKLLKKLHRDYMENPQPVDKFPMETTESPYLC